MHEKGRGGEVYDVAVSDQQKPIRYENITSEPRRFAWQILVALTGFSYPLKIRAWCSL
jgi:phosphatidylserine/phosphatidylglycerophosphate/cardiolipin synthase-like enzyme